MKRKAVAGVIGVVALGGCGDPMLPSDFSGPPAGAVSGSVLAGGERSEAFRPQLSLEWLAPEPARAGGVSLVGQSLTYRRAVKLQNDWDIGLDIPADGSQFDLLVSGRTVRLGVAKMVYYDDRVPDGRLDWSCRGAACDRVRAVSAQYVAFLHTPPSCPVEGRMARPWLPAGYHYYDVENGVLRELDHEEALSFTLGDSAPADSDPSTDLRAFAAALERSWSLSTLDGC